MSDHSLLRVSLAELLFVLAFFAFGCVALKFANSFWWCLIGFIALMLFLTALVIAVIDRGARQATAIGFIICCSCYGVMLKHPPNRIAIVADNPELDPNRADLPTSRILRLIYGTITSRRAADDSENSGHGLGGGFSGTDEDRRELGIPSHYLEDVPQGRDFMLVGHLIWALALGAAGSRLARFLYCRRAT